MSSENITGGVEVKDLIDYLKLFYSYDDENNRWKICMEQNSKNWTIPKDGIGTAIGSYKDRFLIQSIMINEFGQVNTAFVNNPVSKIGKITYITIEPPRSFEDFNNCKCALICYDN